MEAEKGNKLIAEFTGSRFYDPPFTDNKVFYYFNLPALNGIYEFKRTKFHESWNWLMPVVEKIETLGFYTSIIKASDDTHIFVIKEFEADMYGIIQPPIWRDSKIEATWTTIVEFIKWYQKIEKS